MEDIKVQFNPEELAEGFKDHSWAASWIRNVADAMNQLKILNARLIAENEMVEFRRLQKMRDEQEARVGLHMSTLAIHDVLTPEMLVELTAALSKKVK